MRNIKTSQSVVFTWSALALVAMRGRGLLARYDWLYKWKPT